MHRFYSELICDHNLRPIILSYQCCSRGTVVCEKEPFATQCMTLELQSWAIMESCNHDEEMWMKCETEEQTLLNLT